MGTFMMSTSFAGRSALLGQSAQRENAFMAYAGYVEGGNAEIHPPTDYRSSLPDLRTSLQPRILYATPEMADFVKTGGLGEVAGALPRARCAATTTSAC